MKLQVSFVHLQSNKEIVDYAESKLEKIRNLIHNPTNSELILSKDHHQIKAEIILNAENIKLVSHAQDENIEKAIDMAFQKLKSQSFKWKEKKTNHKKAS